MNTLRIKRMPIQEMDLRLRQEVDVFIERFNGTIFHETAFNLVTSETQCSHLTYYLAYKDSGLAGICPSHTFNRGLVKISFSNLTSFDLPYGGWIYDPCQVSLGELLTGTKLELNEVLQISTNIEITENVPYVSQSIPRFMTGQTVILKLDGWDEEGLFDTFKHAQKNKIRKATKMGVEIANIPPEQIDEFYGLLKELKDSLGKTTSPQEYYKKIYTHYHAQGRACCLIARYAGENISSLIMLANKSFATIWFGGRKIGIPNNLYQNELMIWEAIKWALSCGSKFFDLCTIDEQRYPQLARIKLSFSKDVKNYYFFSIKGFAFKLLNRLQGRIG